MPDGSALDVTQWLGRPDAELAPQGIAHSVLDLLHMPDQGASLIAVLEALRGPQVQPYVIALPTLTWCAPIPQPRRNVFCVGRNYKEHIIEGNLARGRDLQDFPRAVEFFTKPPSAVTGHLHAVSSHSRSTQMLDYEVELAIVIGKPGINIAQSEALDHVFGYTIINDITARDLQTRHGQWFKGKALDGTCPMGPFVVPKKYIASAEQLSISLSVNGELRQNSNTSDLLFGIAEIIHQLSDGMALEPGDVIATGTPSGVGLGLNPQRFLKAGDVVSAQIESIGELTNTISQGDPS